MEIKRNLEIKKTYTVDGKEYSSKQEAKQALALSILHTHIPKDLDEVLKNADEIVEAIKVIKRIR